jgi:hypothetical protein
VTARCPECRYLVNAPGHEPCRRRRKAAVLRIASAPGAGLMTPGETAAAFRVRPETVTRWAAEEKLESVRTPGGHRRYLAGQVRAVLRGEAWPPPEDGSPS